MQEPTNYDYTSSESEAERPRKRARIASESHEPSVRQILLEEIDLEVALRQRLASTIESRITWALLLQETLARDLSLPDNGTDFREAALDALDAIEGPCKPLFTHDVRQIHALPPPISTPPTPIPTPSAGPAQVAPSSAYSTRNRGSHRAPRAAPKKLLFIRNTAIYPPQLAKLACPDCSRTDFSSLQGLLNHCRLSHKREFGSHDDCVQSSAVLVETPEEQAHIIANGTEVAGITIPGLRRLFELAVKGDRELLPLLPPKKSEVPSVRPADASTTGVAATSEPAAEPSASSAVHASRTLGYHADIPALAALLGREPKQRVINTHDEDAPLDIFGGHAGPQKSIRWRMAYTHRNKARAELDEIVEPAPLAAELPAESQLTERQLSSTPTIHGPGQFSRFHMMARVSIKDLCRWTPPNLRLTTREDYTHKWQLQVSSPSYSLPLSTILSKLVVTSATDPPPSCLSQPIILDAPPFVVTDTSDAAFLARLTFHWAGGDELNPPLEVDHWVELDPMNTGSVVQGEEQVFDVGLDRNTKMLPAVEEPVKVSWDLPEERPEVQNQRGTPAEDTTGCHDEQEEPDYVVRLRTLLPQFPMTQKDTKDRLPREVPYTLVATPAQFRHLVLGRRKAIEWGRANALREAYEQLCKSDPWEDGRTDIPLTTGDVFRWLEDGGYFLRKAQQHATPQVSHHKRAKRTAIKAEERPADDHCRFCGLHYTLHPAANATELQQYAGVGLDSVKLEPIVDSIPTIPAILTSVCTAFNCTSVELPVLDVNRLTCASTHMSECAPDGLHHSLVQPHGENFAKPGADIRYRDLAGTANPALIRAIQELGRRWKMTRLPNADDSALMPKHRAEADTQTAPIAALALAVRGLARTLIHSGVDEYRRDEAGLRAYGKARGRRGAEGRLLTPAHVVRGLLHDAPGDRASSALLLALLPVGMSLPMPPLEGNLVAPGMTEEDAPDVETAPDP